MKVNLVSIIISVILCVISILAICWYLISVGLPTDRRDEFGMFGDFIGGTLNPILTFVTIGLLLYGLYLQSKGLDQSNETLLATQEELKQSRDIADLQVNEANNAANLASLFMVLDLCDKSIQEILEEKCYGITNNTTLATAIIDPVSFEEQRVPNSSDPSKKTRNRPPRELAERMRILDMFLKLVEEIEPISPVNFFYRKKYSGLLRHLQRLGYVDKKFSSAWRQYCARFMANKVSEPEGTQSGEE